VEALRSADLIFIDGPKDGEWEQHACLEIFGQLLSIASG
jgi:hypothetical protein